jgi:hypothetical protein
MLFVKGDVAQISDFVDAASPSSFCLIANLPP